MNEYMYFKIGYENFCKVDKLTKKIKNEMKDLIRQFNTWYELGADKEDVNVKNLKSDYYKASLTVMGEKKKDDR